MYIAGFDLGSLGANGIVGAGAPLSTGTALTLNIKGADGVAMCFRVMDSPTKATFLKP